MTPALHTISESGTAFAGPAGPSIAAALVARLIVLATQCMQAPIVQFLANLVMVITLIGANAWLPYTNVWETLGGISLIQRCESTMPTVDPFCVPIYRIIMYSRPDYRYLWNSVSLGLIMCS